MGPAAGRRVGFTSALAAMAFKTWRQAALFGRAPPAEDSETPCGCLSHGGGRGTRPPSPAADPACRDALPRRSSVRRNCSKACRTRTWAAKLGQAQAGSLHCLQCIKRVCGGFSAWATIFAGLGRQYPSPERVRPHRGIRMIRGRAWRISGSQDPEAAAARRAGTDHRAVTGGSRELPAEYRDLPSHWQLGALVSRW